MFELEISRFNSYALANGMNYLTLVDFKQLLTGVKESMEHSRDTLLEHTFEFGQNVEAISGINTQLEIVNHNLEAIDKAMKMQEAQSVETVEKFVPLDLHTFSLN